MPFHLGKPILVMLAVALFTGGFVAMRPNQRKADLTMWVFADSHYQAFNNLVPTFEQRTGLSVNLNLVVGQAMDLRLLSLFMTNPKSEQLPDVVEIEIGLVGRYFRPPLDEVGFIPLNDMLKESGWLDKIVRQRFTPWTKENVIFGIPHDVHPVTILYRDDLYREAGIDLSQAKTWPEFHEACLKFEQYWRAKGYKERHALEAAPGDPSIIQQILLQRHINMIDQYNQVHINDPRVTQTVCFYAQLVAGPRAVGGFSMPAGGVGALSNDVNGGNICAFFTADWRLTYLKKFAGETAGKMRMMPLPKFDPTDAPTSTWGGTMVGITKACKDPKRAFKLIEFLYFSPEGIRTRQQTTDILPPLKTAWSDEIYHRPDPFLGGQRGAELYTQLAHQLPERFQSPASPLAAVALQYVLNNCVSYIKDHNSADGLEARCQHWLDFAAKDLNRRIEHWRVD
ncbi:MAG TPA: extracellular solute-binding protein [Tepidisphaeraceae bacterium]|jgi:arabinosaccharide transport system substrate-binding protein